MFFDNPDSSIDRRTFLQEYWQKKPLLIRQALPNFSDPLSPEELAGLACEEAIESRIIVNNDDALELKSGPFMESDFTSLPDDNWTLLVQSVDPWFDEVKQLLELVAFLPAWRIDDVMVSYAEKNAGAGPHFDYYDVFIIQGQGSRNWKIGQQCDSHTELCSDSGLKLLKHFEQQEEWVLNCGDVLYIPPGRAHYGISLDSSLSYSIGFRAPSLSEMLISYSDEVCAELTEDQRYGDLSIDADISQGEISAAALKQVQQQVLAAVNNPEAINTWFGKHMTETKLPGLIEAPEQIISPEQMQGLLLGGEIIQKHPVSRLAWHQQQEGEGSKLVIFADGDSFAFSSPTPALHHLNSQLNAKDEDIFVNPEATDDPDCLAFLCDLYNQGTLIFKETFK